MCTCVCVCVRVRACVPGERARASSRRYVHVRALQLQDPPNRLPTRLVDTNTTSGHRLQHQTAGPPPRIARDRNTLRSSVLRSSRSFSSLFLAATTRGYARSNHARSRGYTPIDPCHGLRKDHLRGISFVVRRGVFKIFKRSDGCSWVWRGGFHF